MSTPVATESLARGSQRAPAPGRPARRGPAADPGRRRLGQDARADPPHRAPGRHRAGRPGRDPRDHVHQQGRAGDARARRAAGRPPGARDVGDDLPLGLRAHAAQRRGAARLHARLHDLRRAGLAAPGQELRRGARRRPQALRAARDPRGRSPTPRTRCSTPRPTGSRWAASSSRPRPTSTTSTSSACTRPTRWTSTTCCSAA